MAKKQQKNAAHEKEHLIHCSGPDWKGDGSKATSNCPFKRSRVLVATRYKCRYCTAKLTRNNIFADHDGITKVGLNTPLPTPSPLKQKHRPKVWL